MLQTLAPVPQTVSRSRDIYTVTRLNREARAVLETSFPLVWVEGEISNLSRPGSGHLYFSLKDVLCQVRCALFRTQRLRLRVEPENGMQVLARARVSLYEGRGDFQLIVEYLEAAGEGMLRQRFEILKNKLAEEGLFDARYKKPLPPLPTCIGVITSPTGAAIKDVLSVLKRRFPRIPVIVYPTSVQGNAAPEEISRALAIAAARSECSVLILCRGGGSLEDLWAFNDESVARAIYASPIPVISGVGHDIDYTIADFVADVRAPTPSVAAELACPDSGELLRKIRGLDERARLVAQKTVRDQARRHAHAEQRLRGAHPKNRIAQNAQRTDVCRMRLAHAFGATFAIRKQRLGTLQVRLNALHPGRWISQTCDRLGALRMRVDSAIAERIRSARLRTQNNAHLLHSMSPLAVLARGYSITRRHGTTDVIRAADERLLGQRIETLLASGSLISEVQSVERPASSDTDEQSTVENR